jgi:hypothetical protein
MISELIADGWQNFTERSGGPMHLRFVLQPAVASLLAIRSGWKDARTGRPAFLWGAFTDPSARGELLRSGWKDVGKVFVIACALDAIYQFIVFKRISALGMLFTGSLLALVPYSILRGPANRISGRLTRHGGGPQAGSVSSGRTA